MKHRRLWSRLLGMALIIVIAVSATTLKAYAKTHIETSYIWSEDWSQVTATQYSNRYDDYPPNSRESSTELAKETVDTVITYDEDGKLVYTAHFTNSAFIDQTRTCRGSDDTIISWNFDTDPASEGWSCGADYSWWSSNLGRTEGSGGLNFYENMVATMESSKCQFPFFRLSCLLSYFRQFNAMID